MDTDPTDAATIGSDYAACKTGGGPIPTPDPCDPQCSNVGMAYITCSDVACFCPTIVASGLGCSSCLATVDRDPTDAASVGAAYSTCKAALTSKQHSTNGTHSALTPSTSVLTPSKSALTPSASASSFAIPPTSSSQGSISTSSVVVQPKSGARGFAAEVVGTGYIQMIIFIAMMTSLFYAFV